MKRMIWMAAVALAVLLTGCGTDREPLTNPTAQWTDTASRQTEPTVPPETVPRQTEETTQPAGLASESEEREEPLFTSLELEVTEGALYIRSGDGFSLTDHSGAPVEYELGGSTLHVRHDRGGDVVLTLPEGERYETVALAVTNGHIYGEGALAAGDLSLELEQGEVRLELVSVSGACRVQVDSGTATLAGDVGGDVTANCQAGQIYCKVPFDQAECSITMDVTSGDMNLDGVHYHGESDSWSLEGGERQLALTCSHGDISMEFGKPETGWDYSKHK